MRIVYWLLRRKLGSGDQDNATGATRDVCAKSARIEIVEHEQDQDQGINNCLKCQPSFCDREFILEWDKRKMTHALQRTSMSGAAFVKLSCPEHRLQ